MIEIMLTSVFVDNQEKALKFYTEVLGFVTKMDLPLGEARWLTVVSPADPEGTQLLLEPNDHPAARAYQAAIFQDGIPTTTFFVDDIEAEFSRMKNLGAKFTMEPAVTGSVKTAVLEDTCGNLIQLTQL